MEKRLAAERLVEATMDIREKWLGIKLSADSLVWGNMILLYFLIALGVVFLIAEGVQRYLARRRD